jgi:ketosteroid isomerase-like protein
MDVVRRYYEVVADLDATPDQLAELLHPDLRIVEHPNAINREGTARNRDEALAAYASGKGLLTSQTFDIQELLVSGDRVAVRATWTGTARGTPLTAHVAAFLTVADGLIREHETFDCYEPF